jgi:hypothetical protein
MPFRAIHARYMRADLPSPVAIKQRMSCPFIILAVHPSWNGAGTYGKEGPTRRRNFLMPSTVHQLYSSRLDQSKGGGIVDIVVECIIKYR